MEATLISIIIVNYNGKRWFKKCLDSLDRQTYKNIEIILIDNQSTDDSLEYLYENYPTVRIIPLQSNVGFSSACNTGVCHAKGDVYLFLNTDTYCDCNFIETLFLYKNKKKLNIAGPQILDFNGKKFYSNGFLSIDAYGYVGWEQKKAFYIEGCALMISRVDFKTLGGFDEKYFMYSEDIDLCWRALIFGMKLGISETAELYHFGGGSSENTSPTKKETHVIPYFRRYEVEKNNLRNLLKNYQVVNLLWALPIFLILSCAEAIFYMFTGASKASRLIFKAIQWNFDNLRDTLRERKKNQFDRKVCDVEILRRMTGIIPNKFKGLLVVGIPRFK